MALPSPLAPLPTRIRVAEEGVAVYLVPNLPLGNHKKWCAGRTLRPMSGTGLWPVKGYRLEAGASGKRLFLVPKHSLEARKNIE